MLPVLLLLSLVGMIWIPDLNVQVMVLVVGVGTIGLAHGAMDHRVGEMLLKRTFNGRWPIIFAAAYLILAALIVLVWFMAPTFAMTAFLIYSAFHFGSGKRQGDGPLLAIAAGSLPILLPLVFHPNEVSKVFEIISATEFDVMPFMQRLTIASVVSVLLTLFGAFRRRSGVSAIETIFLLTINYTNPPLIAFTVYFVLLHSVRHLTDLAEWLEPNDFFYGLRRVARESLPLTALTIGGMILGVTVLDHARIDSAIIRVVFVTLAALTVPHMVLTYLAGRAFGCSSRIGLRVDASAELSAQ